jgi:segregation and condensation protein B
MEDIKPIIESLLFIAEEPLSVDRIKRILGQAQSGEIREALEAIANEHDTRRSGFHLHPVAGGWQFRTRPEYNLWIKKLIQPKPLRLSKAALETLVIIAYKQPIIRSDIEHLRGVDCGGVLRALLERKLIRVLGRREIAGRPLIYATTKRFLEVFDLKTLRDLPTPKEIHDLGAAGVESELAASLEKVADPQALEISTDDDKDPASDERSQTPPATTSEAQAPLDSLRETDVDPVESPAGTAPKNNENS